MEYVYDITVGILWISALYAIHQYRKSRYSVLYPFETGRAKYPRR